MPNSYHTLFEEFQSYLQGEHFYSNKPPQVSLVFAITSTLLSIEPKDSLTMGDNHLSIFRTEEIVPIPRESEETSRNDSKNVLPSCDDFSSIEVPRDDSVTFSNPLFNEELEDIECKDSYDSNLDESTFLVTPLSDSNKDESLIPRDDIEFLLHDDPSTPLKSVVSILEGFINNLPFEENENLFNLECKTNDEAECFNPGGDNDEIDAFLAIEVPTYIEGYYDSEGDVLYLESLLSEDTTHNLSPKVFFDYEPQQLRNEPENEPLITFSPKSDPLHHEFTGELITIPPGIVREHEDYINRMSLLCSNSFSQSPENFHTIIESLPTSTTLIEDSDPNREEIDIFSGPDDSIPPGIESDFDSEEDIIDNLLNGNPTHEESAKYIFVWLSSEQYPLKYVKKSTIMLIEFMNDNLHQFNESHSKLQISPPSSHEPTSPHNLNPLLDNISDVPPRPLNSQPLQSHHSLDITISLSQITHLDHIHDTPSPPSPPQPQPPIMGHPLFYNYHDFHASTCICFSHNQNLFFTLRDEMNIMFAHLEYLLTTAITSHFPPPP
ncbi:hypothetical protein Tco_0688132 [Tanacetum coccineum]